MEERERASAPANKCSARASASQPLSVSKPSSTLHSIQKFAKSSREPASTRCPICAKRFLYSFIQAHASSCSTSRAPRARSKTKSTNPLSSWLTPRFRPRLTPFANPSETAAPGFHVFPNVFVKDEQTLLTQIESTAPAWVDYMFRKTKNYGPAYDLRKRRFLFGERAPKQIPLPAYATDIVLPRLRSLTTLLNQFEPNQLAVGLYKVPGESHILPHNDCENGNIATAVVGVCLAGACTMTLILRSRYSGVGHDIKKDVRLPPSAVYVMSGDALRVWEHAIFPGKTEATRYSLTFRDVSPKDPGNYVSPTSKRKQRFKQSVLK